jgi:hypothetical protein
MVPSNEEDVTNWSALSGEIKKSLQHQWLVFNNG